MERYHVSDPSLLKFLVKRLIGSFTKEFSTNKLYNDFKENSKGSKRAEIVSVKDNVCYSRRTFNLVWNCRNGFVLSPFRNGCWSGDASPCL